MQEERRRGLASALTGRGMGWWLIPGLRLAAPPWAIVDRPLRGWTGGTMDSTTTLLRPRDPSTALPSTSSGPAGQASSLRRAQGPQGLAATRTTTRLGGSLALPVVCSSRDWDVPPTEYPRYPCNPWFELPVVFLWVLVFFVAMVLRRGAAGYGLKAALRTTCRRAGVWPLLFSVLSASPR